jgi:vacuole morphology and inheritance protein 14
MGEVFTHHFVYYINSTMGSGTTTRSNVRRPDDIRWQDLLSHFRSVQVKHERARQAQAQVQQPSYGTPSSGGGSGGGGGVPAGARRRKPQGGAGKSGDAASGSRTPVAPVPTPRPPLASNSIGNLRPFSPGGVPVPVHTGLPKRRVASANISAATARKP